MPGHVYHPGVFGVPAMVGRGRIKRSKASNCRLLSVYDVPKVAQVGVVVQEAQGGPSRPPSAAPPLPTCASHPGTARRQEPCRWRPAVGCCRCRFHAAPGAPWQAGRCEDGRYIVGGERIGLAAAPARRLSVDALQNAAHAIMAGRIGGAGVDMAGADRGADGAHGGRGGALVDPLGKVGGDGERIGGQGGVSVQRRPFGPPAPSRPILRASVGGAAIEQRPIDARPVGCAQFDRQGNGERCGCGSPSRQPAEYDLPAVSLGMDRPLRVGAVSDTSTPGCCSRRPRAAAKLPVVRGAVGAGQARTPRRRTLVRVAHRRGPGR